MPAFPALDQTAVNAIVQYLVTGRDTPAAARGGRGRPEPAMSPLINNDFRFTGYRKFLDPEGYPATAPPWGTLSAINLNTGAYAWQVPLGEYPELVAKGMTGTGSENYGGPIVTAGGLVIIGATNQDRKLRVFDKATGALIWETVMPGPGRATPATYEVDGRQYIAIALGGVSADAAGAGASAAGGPSTGGRGAATTAKYIAFALPVSDPR
jgi:quinoprotein glucose dehydrogenase